MSKTEELTLHHLDDLAEPQDEDSHQTILELAGSTEELLQFGYWSWDPKKETMKWSKGMYVLMDFDPDAVHGLELTMEFYRNHVIPEDREKLKTVFDKAKTNKEKSVEYKHTVITRRQQRKIFHSKVKIVIDHRGNVKNIVGITRDITESTLLRDALNNYRRMVQEKEDFLGHGSWEWDLIDKKTIWWSDGMYRLFGYDPRVEKSQVDFREDFYKLHLTEETLDKACLQLKESLKKGDNNYAFIYEIKNRKGETKILESNGKIVRDKTGKGVKLMGTTRDVTQIKKYEFDLEQKISELNRLSKELEDSAYAASHDLQEPLRKISTLIDRLQYKFNGILAEDGRKYIDRIQSATKNARSLVESLLEFSRITHETQTFRETDLNILLREVKGDLELKIEETHTIITSGKLPTLEASSPQLKQLFSNIILNSIKFKKPNVLPLIDIRSRSLGKAEIQNHRLDFTIPYVLITIKDNGIGFDEEYATKIFQMFSRLHGKSEYPGAGIGLALCKKIIESHKGRIFATAAADDGAVFSIILPEKHV